jgi:hypothetical protein
MDCVENILAPAKSRERDLISFGVSSLHVLVRQKFRKQVRTVIVTSRFGLHRIQVVNLGAPNPA